MELAFLAWLRTCFYQLPSAGQEGTVLSCGARLRASEHFSTAKNCLPFVMRVWVWLRCREDSDKDRE